MYGPGEFDLAGFCTGIVDRAELLPKKERMQEGDVILALPSTGIHSNGFSLARKALAGESDAVMDMLMAPTKIYVRELKALLATGTVLGAAHITGGGLEANFARVLPDGIAANFFWNWEVPQIFGMISDRARVPLEEMKSVFNMGVGIAFVVAKEDKDKLLASARNENIEVLEIGVLRRG